MAKSIRPAKTARRRDELRRNLPKPTLGLRSLLQRPESVNAILILGLFAVVVSVLTIWSRSQIRVHVGQVMTETRLNRMDFSVVDEARTDEARREARERAPLVYTLAVESIDGLRAPLENLPVLVAEQSAYDDIREDLRIAYGLDAATMELLPRYAEEGKPTDAWMSWVDRLLQQVLVRHPIIPSDEWQQGLVAPESPQLRSPSGSLVARWSDAIPLGGDDTRAALRRDHLPPIVRKAGFPDDVAGYVVAGLASVVPATFVRDDAAAEALAEERAAAIAIPPTEYRRGDVIYRRGDELSDQQLARLRQETERYLASANTPAMWLPRVGVFGLVLLLTVFGGGFTVAAYPRIRRNGLRLVSLCVLMATMLALTVVLSAQVPQLIYPAMIAPTLFVAIIVLLAYDQRLALFLTTLYCALVVLATGTGASTFVLLMVGAGAMIAQLRDVRQRNSLIRAAFGTAVVLGAGTVLLGLYLYPPVENLWLAVLSNGAWAFAASAVVGFLVLGILPSVERLFDITTGMTLAELRDPSQPLLRQLQQRAPGTYNHSIQVANIAEAAADAIGADSLLVYVGALYHDIGKMNKPEYFVENQAGGFNKHSKLRPAMSLLVIVGHVKDGIELAREYGLPRTLQHFIEAHHGTTLVEYFYHAAKTQAEMDDKAAVDEVEFRYPGPKPRTKEAAIMMISDAVESATRAMTEPNPSRIESLVRELSRKRLLDGQFDECDLTFRELGLIEDAIIARLNAIHHARISYPTTSEEDQAVAKPA